MKRLLLPISLLPLALPSHACACLSNNTFSDPAVLIPYLLLCFVLALVPPLAILASARPDTLAAWLCRYMAGLAVGLAVSLGLATLLAVHGLLVNLALLSPPALVFALFRRQRSLRNT